MKKIIILTAAALLLTSGAAFGESDFCRGFAEGFKSMKGNFITVPVCPVEPVPPANLTDYQNGVLEGVKEAQRTPNFKMNEAY